MPGRTTNLIGKVSLVFAVVGALAFVILSAVVLMLHRRDLLVLHGCGIGMGVSVLGSALLMGCEMVGLLLGVIGIRSGCGKAGAIISAVLLVCFVLATCSKPSANTLQVRAQVAVRAEPSPDSRVICTLYKGEQVNILETAEKEGKTWCLLETPKCLFGDQYQGWVEETHLVSPAERTKQ